MTTIAECQAYKIIEPITKDRVTGLPTFRANDAIAIASQWGYWDIFCFGSVVSYSLNSGYDPISAVNRAIDSGHALHWLNPTPVSLSNTRKRQEAHVGMKWGDEVIFEGLRFRIEPAPNHNAKLVEVRT